MKRTTEKINSQEGGLLNFLGPLMKDGLPLTKIVLKLWAKSVFIQLGLTATVSTADASIQTKNYGCGVTTLIIANKQMKVSCK